MIRKDHNDVIYKNEAGRKVVRIEFAGEQTNYSENELIKGTNIILNCNLTVDSMEENKLPRKKSPTDP